MNGGRLILRVKRGFENRVWEELILHYLSDDNPHLQGVCGIVKININSLDCSF